MKTILAILTVSTIMISAFSGCLGENIPAQSIDSVETLIEHSKDNIKAAPELAYAKIKNESDAYLALCASTMYFQNFGQYVESRPFFLTESNLSKLQIRTLGDLGEQVPIEIRQLGIHRSSDIIEIGWERAEIVFVADSYTSALILFPMATLLNAPLIQNNDSAILGEIKPNVIVHYGGLELNESFGAKNIKFSSQEEVWETYTEILQKKGISCDYISLVNPNDCQIMKLVKEDIYEGNITGFGAGEMNNAFVGCVDSGTKISEIFNQYDFQIQKNISRIDASLSYAKDSDLSLCLYGSHSYKDYPTWMTPYGYKSFSNSIDNYEFARIIYPPEQNWSAVVTANYALECNYVLKVSQYSGIAPEVPFISIVGAWLAAYHNGIVAAKQFEIGVQKTYSNIEYNETYDDLKCAILSALKFCKNDKNDPCNLCIAGDHISIPFYFPKTNYTYDNVATDNYYADIDGDVLTAELPFGRFVAESIEDVSSMFVRTVNYRKLIDSTTTEGTIQDIAQSIDFVRDKVTYLENPSQYTPIVAAETFLNTYISSSYLEKFRNCGYKIATHCWSRENIDPIDALSDMETSAIVMYAGHAQYWLLGNSVVNTPAVPLYAEFNILDKAASIYSWTLRDMESAPSAIIISGCEGARIDGISWIGQGLVGSSIHSGSVCFWGSTRTWANDGVSTEAFLDSLAKNMSLGDALIESKNAAIEGWEFDEDFRDHHVMCLELYGDPELNLYEPINNG